MLKKILTYFEMLIVPHALHCVDSCIFVFTSFDTVWHTVLVSVPAADVTVSMKDQPIPIVSETMHMGIPRSTNTQETAVDENIRKARRTIYGLMAAGLHGESGLDPETSVHLLHVYVLPVLTYGLDVILPKKILLDKLGFSRNF